MHRSTLLKGAVFVGAYFVLARVGIPLHGGSIDASPFWLPTGLSFVAIVVFGDRFWPAVVVAVTVQVLGGDFPPLLALALGGIKAGQVLLGARLLRGPGRFDGALDNVRAVLALILGGAVLTSFAGGVSSAAAFRVAGFTSPDSFFELAATWWLGDAMGVLIVVPTVLAFVRPGNGPFDRAAAISVGTTLLLLLASCEVAFGQLLPPASGLPLAYLPFPVIFWATLRFGIRGAALSSTAASLLATIGTLRGFGPFARESTVGSLVQLETFLAVIIVTSLLLGAVIEERRKTSAALGDSQRRYDLASRAGCAGVWDWNLATGEIYVDPVLKNALGYEDEELQNHIDAWKELIHPDDVERVMNEAQRHAEGETPRFEIEHRMLKKDGSVRWFLARGEAQRDAAGKAVRMAGTDVDITPRKKSEKLLAGSNRVLELVAEGESLEGVMDVLAKNVEAQTGCGCLVRVVTPDGTSLQLAAAPSLSADDDGGFQTVPIGDRGGSCGEAARKKTAVVTPDISNDPSWSELRSEAEARGVRSSLSVPVLSSADDVLGTVALYCHHPRTAESSELDAADNAAHLARVAIEHARARDAVRRSQSSLRESRERTRHLAGQLIAAQEEERRRVSRELHDGLNQQLAALSFEIGKLRAQVPEDRPEMSERLSELQSRASRLIDDARRMSHELHPSILEHLGLVAAVRAYCDEVDRRGDIQVRFDPVRAPENIRPEAALCLFRIVQEGVRNAFKHSGAALVRVTLDSSAETVELAITDDGCGFDSEVRTNGGLGLVSMAERVRALGGEFQVVSKPKEGTRIKVRLPADRKERGLIRDKSSTEEISHA